MTWLSWLGRRFTSARALCVVLLFALLFLRVTNPLPLEELRLRAFDIFQVIKPRVATLRPAVIQDILEGATSAEQAARRLVNRANLAGAGDNVTVAVVRAT